MIHTFPIVTVNHGKQWFIDNIKTHLTIEHSEGCNGFLGVDIVQDVSQGRVEILIRDLIEQAVQRFKPYCEGIHPRNIPAAASAKFKKATEDEHATAKALPYQKVVGVLIFIAGWCKIECQTIVSMLGQHMHCWTKTHFDAAIRALMYCYGTRHRGICFHRGASNGVRIKDGP